MMRAGRVGAIARFEFLGVAKRTTYVLVTFGLPVFFTLLGGGMLTLQAWFLQDEVTRESVYGILDHQGVLREAPIWTDGEVDIEGSRFRLFDTEEAGVAAVRAEELDALYVVEADWLETGEVRCFAPESGPVLSVRAAAAEPVLGRLLTDRLLRHTAPDAVVERALQPMVLARTTVTRGGLEEVQRDPTLDVLIDTAVPFLLGVLLLTALLSASGYLVQTVALDKESKVVEVLLSSADPDEILTGKLLGLGAAGLLQFVVWAAMVVGGAASAASAGLPIDVELPWGALAIAPVFFVMGYLFTGSLMLTTGAMGSSVPESQKLTLGWALLAVLPLMMMVVLLEQPHGGLGRLLTWLPFSAPLTVIVRMSIDPAGISTGEILGSLGVLLASTWLTLRLGARLFRVGLLMTGPRPSWRELLRQARLLE